MIPLVLILAAAAALTLVIVINSRRSPQSVTRRGDGHPSWTHISSNFSDSSGTDCSDSSGGGDCGDGGGGGGD